MLFVLLKGKGKQRDSTFFGVRVAAGITTGGLAVIVAQPTDVVKVKCKESLRISKRLDPVARRP